MTRLLALAGDVTHGTAVAIRRAAAALDRLAARFDAAWLAWTADRDGG